MVTHTHPTLPEFEYIQPESLAAASAFLAGHAGEARPFLGGTDIFVRMRDGIITPKFLLDVKRLPGMNDLHFDPQTGLMIGAAVNMNRVAANPEVRAHYALLAEACQAVAGYQLRNRATIVGNICNASPAGDTLGACLALDGRLHIHGLDGSREEALAGFFLGPGKTKLKAGDLVTGISFPLPPPGCTGTYLKLGRNKISDLSIVGVTVLAYPDPHLKSGLHFHIVLASVAPIPLVVVAAENYLGEQPITPESIHQAARLAGEACTPIDDVRSSARYRKLMVKNLTRTALTNVWHQLHP
ncbi:MAG TPA: xanthine dehydrogenase family protein subunit M [Anaerolineaceae bacterium]|nr:xanthine dehydrogenase family protein subunit M [Anaerolineaceae bacterium]